MDTLFITILPLLSVITGGILQYLFTRQVERSKQKNSLKIQAYIDLMKGFSGMAIGRKNGDTPRINEASTLTTDARARIAIYGSKEVISSLSEFFSSSGGNMAKEEDQDKFIAIIQAMRDENKKGTSVSKEDIQALLFK